MTLPSGLWGEGDPLSPTNLNARSPAGNFPAKTYHVAWAGGTGTTQINNAITNAVAGGYSYLFIDKSRLPFDASLVTFNTALRLVREGQGNWDEYDVRAYGAAGNASQDDFYAIDACTIAINAQPDTAGILTLRFPPGRYFSSQPIWTRRPGGIRFAGSAQGIGTEIGFGVEGRSSIELTAAGGPVVLLAAGTSTVVHLGTSLVTGSGNSWDSSGGLEWFNLSDLPINLNGLTAFTVELFYQSTYTNASDKAYLAYSSGSILAADTRDSAFELYKNLSDTLTFTLTTTAGTATLNGTTATQDGVTRHVAGTWDGTTVRLFVNGVLEASAALAGTLIQKVHEEIILGPGGFRVGEHSSTSNGPRGKQSSVRLSNQALYTTAFAPPTAEFSPAASTIILTNFEGQRGPMVKAYTASNTGWLVQRNSSPTSTSAFHAEGVGFVGGSPEGATGIFFRDSCTHWTIDRCTFAHSVRYLYQPGTSNGFDFSIQRCNFGGGNNNRFGIVRNGFGGIGSIRDCWIDSSPYPLINVGGVDISSVFIQAEAGNAAAHGTICAGAFFGFQVSANPAIIRNVFFNTEPGAAADFRAVWLIEGGQSAAGATFDNCVFENVSTKPFIITSGSVKRLSFHNTNFNTVGTAPAAIVNVASGTPSPIVFDNCFQEDAWIPWSDTTGTAVVTQIGPLYSTSTGGTINFDAYAADAWDLTLTSDVTQSSWTHISYGQPVSGAIKMDSTGSRLFTWPTNSKGTATLSYGSSAVNTFTGFYDGVNVILTSVRTGL